ncbi:unnamed protein product [Amoebophrya sp. A25]|nr:unnamed protein product [Amoebophrya sp. A25]|eukprot:GSA25T00027937001.1
MSLIFAFKESLLRLFLDDHVHKIFTCILVVVHKGNTLKIFEPLHIIYNYISCFVRTALLFDVIGSPVTRRVAI